MPRAFVVRIFAGRRHPVRLRAGRPVSGQGRIRKTISRRFGRFGLGLRWCSLPGWPPRPRRPIFAGASRKIRNANSAESVQTFQARPPSLASGNPLKMWGGFLLFSLAQGIVAVSAVCHFPPWSNYCEQDFDPHD